MRCADTVPSLRVENRGAGRPRRVARPIPGRRPDEFTEFWYRLMRFQRRGRARTPCLLVVSIVALLRLRDSCASLDNFCPLIIDSVKRSSRAIKLMTLICRMANFAWRLSARSLYQFLNQPRSLRWTPPSSGET